MAIVCTTKAEYARYLGIEEERCRGFPNYFLNNALVRKGFAPQNASFKQCFFGEHLLAQRPDDIVCIVESEKTAVVCSICYPSYVWLATGGGEQLSVDKLTVLKGRHKVVVFPDSGELQKWNATLSEAKDINYSITKDLEAYPPNTDIADLILEEMTKATSSDNAPLTPDMPFEYTGEECPF